MKADTETPITWIRESRRTTIKIKDAYVFTGVVDRVVKSLAFVWKSITSDEPSESSYFEQIRVSYRWDEDDEDEDDTDEDDEDEQALVNESRTESYADATGADVGRTFSAVVAEEDDAHGVFDYFVWSWLVLFKVVIAIFTPPADFMNGWGLFVTSLAWIGIVTAFCADFATGIGCSIGLKDTVTAITFIALGTSVPDTFASKIAAEENEFADDALGNVTGSNAVNVFLGVGLSWFIAAGV